MAALAVRQPREEVICERLLVDPENKGERALENSEPLHTRQRKGLNDPTVPIQPLFLN